MSSDHVNQTNKWVDYKEIVSDKFQPRKFTDPSTIDGLALSIEKYGKYDPLLVWKDEENEKYVIVDGHRRYKAIVKLIEEGNEAYKQINVDVVEGEKEIAEDLSIIKNLQREDFCLLDKADAIKDFADKKFKQNEKTSKKDIAQLLGMSPQNFSNYLGLTKISTLARKIYYDEDNSKFCTLNDLANIAKIKEDTKQVEVMLELIKKKRKIEGKISDRENKNKGKERTESEKYKQNLNTLSKRLFNLSKNLDHSSEENTNEEINLLHNVFYMLNELSKSDEFKGWSKMENIKQLVKDFVNNKAIQKEISSLINNEKADERES